MRIGRIVLGVVMGFLFFLFIAIDLFLFGVIPLESVVITALPLLGALTGGVLSWLAERQRAAAPPAPLMAQAPPAPMAAPMPPPPPAV